MFLLSLSSKEMDGIRLDSGHDVIASPQQKILQHAVAVLEDTLHRLNLNSPKLSASMTNTNLTQENPNV